MRIKTYQGDTFLQLCVHNQNSIEEGPSRGSVKSLRKTATIKSKLQDPNLDADQGFK